MDDAVDSAAPGPKEREFELARELRSVGLLNLALERWLLDQGVPEPVLRAVQVCCDEILANAIHHGGDVSGPVHARFLVGDDHLRAQFAYRAHAFDPDGRARPDTHTPISLRSIGGLGIHLLKALTDRFEYHYRDGHHCLEFDKRYPR